jgi:DNA-binding MarR family transcriptional regulator
MKELIYENIATAGTIEEAGSRILKPFGLTPMTFNILNVLKDGPLSQRQISEKVIVVASSVTFQVRHLQRRGLIKRRRADARTWNVSLTPLGAQTRASAEKQMDAVIGRIDLDPALVAGTKATLRTIQAHLPTVS